MNKYIQTEICRLPGVEELRAALASENSSARDRISLLFDANTFVETGAYTTRGISDFLSTEKANELEGVITGYGAVDGKLVFAFAEESSRMGGVIDERHAKKICDLYKLAISNGAPVIGIFDSKGADIFQGTASLSAYGKIMSVVAKASGKIPQIAFVAGNCIGSCAAIASMFDFVVKSSNASLYVSSPAITGVNDAQDSVLAYVGETEQCAQYIRSLISFIPENSSVGTIVYECTDNLNKKLGELDFAGEALSAISVIVDNGVYYEVGGATVPGVSTVFATVGGVRCGIVANSFAVNEGRITVEGARKITRFISFCDAYSIPVVTLVDSLGLDVTAENEKQYFAPELAKLAFAYTTSTMPKITIIMGHAIGAAFVLLGSKALGADIVYTTDTSEIGALSAESGVAFSWDKYITLEKKREELVNEWKTTVSSPLVACASGEIEDIISINELRARICSALLMLAAKGSSNDARRNVLPL